MCFMLTFVSQEGRGHSVNNVTRVVSPRGLSKTPGRYTGPAAVTGPLLYLKTRGVVIISLAHTPRSNQMIALSGLVEFKRLHRFEL